MSTSFRSSDARPAPTPEHPVAAVLRAALAGDHPPADGSVEVVPPWRPRTEAFVSFTARLYVATSRTAHDVASWGLDACGSACLPDAVRRLAGPDGHPDVLDVLLVAPGTGRTSLPERTGLEGSERVRYARRWRDDVHVHGDERGFVTVGRGVGGLAELSFEVAEERRGRGAGTSLLNDALGLVPAGDPVAVCVAPGNARSLRAALAAGFRPVGSVQLVRLADPAGSPA